MKELSQCEKILYIKIPGRRQVLVLRLLLRARPTHNDMVIKERKKCRCGATTNLMHNGGSVYKKTRYIYYQCQNCNRKEMKKYYATPQGKEAVAAANERYKAKLRAR